MAPAYSAVYLGSGAFGTSKPKQKNSKQKNSKLKEIRAKRPVAPLVLDPCQSERAFRPAGAVEFASVRRAATVGSGFPAIVGDRSDGMD